VKADSTFRIGTRPIGREHPPFVIAEMSGNHNQSLDRALMIVEAAARTGAHALKLQTYTPETMTIDRADGEFRIDDPKSLWAGASLHELYGKAYTPWDWHAPIMRRANQLGMLCFSTPFDETAVDFLETLDVPCYKIASFENTDHKLIERVARTGKPIIISTGMATLAEMDETVRVAREAGCQKLVLLKCTSTYPATPENSNILTIAHMRDLFGCEIGLSDHTLGVGVAVAAVGLGATVIEKHFTLDRAEGGVDSAFSMEPAEFTSLVAETERAWQALGSIVYGPLEVEKPSLRFRRSIYIVEDLEEGAVLNPQNTRRIRPGLGLPPKYYDQLMGRKVRRAVKRGTPVTWDLI
jgi:N-acetylneuraminate synthase